MAVEYDLIVLTQSCDLDQRKVRLMATRPIFPLPEFEAVNPAFARKGRWNEVLKGRIEGLHLLASPTVPENDRQALVVDFREIYSLPYDYLWAYATGLGPRWRLTSPHRGAGTHHPLRTLYGIAHHRTSGRCHRAPIEFGPSDER
jgi:hypothetical protein